MEEDYEEAPAPMVFDTLGYLCPVEKECDESNDTKLPPCEESTSPSLYYSSFDIPGSVRPHSTNGFEFNAEDTTPQMGSLKRNETLSTSNAKAPSYSHSKGIKDHYKEPLRDTKLFNDTTTNSVHYASVSVVRCNVNCESGHSSKARNEVPYCELNTGTNCYQPLIPNRDPDNIYQNEDNSPLREQQNGIKLNDDDSSLYDDVIGCISEDRRRINDFSKDTTPLGEYQNMRCKLDKDDDYDDVTGSLTDDNTRLVEFSADNKFLGEYQNMADALDRDDNSIYDDVIGFPTNGDDDVTNVIEEDDAQLGNHQNMEQDDNMMCDKLQRHALLGQHQRKTCAMDHDDSSMHNALQQPNTQKKHIFGQYQNKAIELAQSDYMYNTIPRGAENNTELDEFRNVVCTMGHGDSNLYDQLQRKTECNAHVDKHQNMACALDQGDGSMYDKLERNTGYDTHVDEHSNMTCALNRGDSSTYDKLVRNTGYNTLVDEHQNMGRALDQGDSSVYDKLGRNTQERTHLVENQSPKSAGFLKGNDKHKHQRNVRVCSYENTAYFQTIPLSVLSKETRKSAPGTKTKEKRKSNLRQSKENVRKSTFRDTKSKLQRMHVLQGQHVHENAQMAFETGHSNAQDPLREQPFLSQLHDPDLEVIHC